MPRVRIINWNIQNYGHTKAGCPDVVKAIAKVVVDNNADIFVMLELNTTVPTTANSLAQTMLNALRGEEGGTTWDVCVLSPNTGLEFYAFFVRDSANTVPLTISGSSVVPGVPDTLGGSALINTGRFRNAGGNRVLPQWFPLIEPDIAFVSKRGRLLGDPPAWDGRRPVLALFWLPLAAPGNRLLPIVACHYAADAAKAVGQFNMMYTFSPLRALAPGPAHPKVTTPYELKIQPPGAAGLADHAPNYYVLLGDFNVDWIREPNTYFRLTNLAAGEGLGATGLVTQTTHLVTLTAYKSRDYKTSDDLIINAYDNFFARGNPPAASTYHSRVPIPALIRTRELKLKESVAHYTLLDQRGFEKREYMDLVRDFTKQLTGETTIHINLNGQLVGARLISDHIPVVMDLNVA